MNACQGEQSKWRRWMTEATRIRRMLLDSDSIVKKKYIERNKQINKQLAMMKLSEFPLTHISISQHRWNNGRICLVRTVIWKRLKLCGSAVKKLMMLHFQYYLMDVKLLENQSILSRSHQSRTKVSTGTGDSANGRRGP